MLDLPCTTYSYLYTPKLQNVNKQLTFVLMAKCRMQICQRLVLQVIFCLLENLNLKSRQFDSLPNDQCDYCQEVTQDPLFVAAI